MRELVDTSSMSLAQKRFDLVKMADLLNKGYEADRRKPSDRAKKSFAPSGVGYGPGQCARRWFYDFNGGYTREESQDVMAIANMAYGTEAHERIQKVFAQAGILVESEKEVRSEHPPVYGYADLIIKWQGEDAVGEIKTTTQESFVSKKAKNQPAGYHLLQVLLYMKILELNKGFLIYENKNTQELLVLPVTWNAANTKFIDDTLEWMENTYANWQAGNLPERPFTQKSVACKACPFYKRCWEDEDGVVSLPPLVVPK